MHGGWGFHTAIGQMFFFSDTQQSYKGIKMKSMVKSMDHKVIFPALRLDSNSVTLISCVGLTEMLNLSKPWFAC